MWSRGRRIAAAVALGAIGAAGSACATTDAQRSIRAAEGAAEVRALAPEGDRAAAAPAGTLSADDDAALARGLDPRRVEMLVIARHPSLVAAAHRVRELAARAGAEGSLPAPELMIDLWQIPIARPYALDKAGMIMIGVRQELPAPGSLDLVSEATALEARAQAAMVAAEARGLVREADRACADYGEATRIEASLGAQQRIVEEMAAAARARYASGGALTDVTRADLEHARVGAAIARARGAIDEARARLNGLLGRPAGAKLGPPAAGEPETIALTEDQVAERAARTSPEVTAADLMEKAARASIRAADREAVAPKFSVAFETFMPVNDMPFGYGASMSMSLPWIWSAGSKRAESAAHRAISARATAEAARLRVRSGAATALVQARSAERRYLVLRDVVRAAAGRARDAARAGYATGGDLIGWLDAARSALDVESELAMAEADLARAIADVDWAAGEHLPRVRISQSKEVAR